MSFLIPTNSAYSEWENVEGAMRDLVRFPLRFPAHSHDFDLHKDSHYVCCEDSRSLGGDLVLIRSPVSSSDANREPGQSSRNKTFESSSPPTANDWVRLRPVITKLYAEQRKTLKEVADIMRTRYGFKASPRMYKPRLDDWGIHKYYSTKQNRCIATILTDYEKSETPFPLIMVNGEALNSCRVRRFWQKQSGDKVLQERMAMLIDKYTEVDETTIPGLERETLDISEMFPLLSQERTIPIASQSNAPSFLPRQLHSNREGSVQAILLNCADYTRWCLQTSDTRVLQPYQGDLLDGVVSISTHGRVKFHSKILWSNFHDGLGLLESGDVTAAFAEFDTGCQLVSSFLLTTPICLFRSLFMVLGTYRWDKFEDARRRLLTFLGSMAELNFGHGHPSSLALRELGNGDNMKSAAELVLRSQLDIMEEHFGPQHSEVVRLRRCISTVLRRQKDFRQAESILRSAVKGTEEHHGPLHEETRRTLRRLGHLFLEQGKLDEAEETFIDVLLRGQALQGTNAFDEDTVYAYQNLAGIEGLRGDKERCKFWLLKEIQAIEWIAKTQGRLCIAGEQIINDKVRLVHRVLQEDPIMSVADIDHTPLFTWAIKPFQSAQFSGNLNTSRTSGACSLFVPGAERST